MDEDVKVEGVGTMSGKVVSVGDGSFEADLVDADDVLSVEGLRVPLADVPEDDRSKVTVGATFTWHEDGPVIAFD